ncbi:hypothetical protein C8Q76DRAFT_361272 [Earliella scabrosa]|nr:hypothetical protein C8Q76DRAFT_361272 [Earliella scabrosa]
MQCWPNLRMVVLSPVQCHESIFSVALSTMLKASSIKHLVFNAAVSQPAHIRLLAQVLELESLTIQSPSCDVLQMLPPWLSRLRSTLRALHFTRNCTLVSRDNLELCHHHLQESTAFTMGHVSPARFLDTDVLPFCSRLARLASLDLIYRATLTPRPTHRLPHLRHLTVNYMHVDEVDEVSEFTQFVLGVIAHARLETLYLVCRDYMQGPPPAFDALLPQLAPQHVPTLRVLSMPACRVSRASLATLLGTFAALEELSVAVSRATLDHFPSIATAVSRLHTVEFRNADEEGPASAVIVQEFAERVINDSTLIRRLTVNGTRYEGHYVLAVDGRPQLKVSQIQ